MSIAITFRALSGWPGEPTPSYKREASRFKSTWTKTVTLLESELEKINAKNVVIEADCLPSEIRIDGHLRANAKLRGPGVILSFDCPKGSLRFPCDNFTDWQANVRAIALSMEALRAVDRYGVTRRAEQYKGWSALQDKRTEQVSAKQAAAEWIVQQAHSNQLGLGFSVATVDEILTSSVIRDNVRRKLLALLHPDRSHDRETFEKAMNCFQILEGQ